jgi:hypothetical protein
MCRTAWLLTLFFLYVASLAFAAVEPTDYEQLHLEAINYARTAPLAEAARLGIDLNEGPPETFITSDAKQPLAFNAALLQAARLHTLDMLTNNYFSHDSLNGDAPWNRMAAQGYNYSYAGENIAWRGSTGAVSQTYMAIKLHDDLFVDSYVIGRGHRLNILNNNFKEIGIGFACGPYQQSGITYNSCMVTCDFGTALSPRPIVTGVVYDDKDGNGHYGVGEGLSGVEVKSLETGLVATTFASGGYSLPLPSGPHTLTFKHPLLGSVTRTVNLSSQNLKLDIKKTEFPGTGADILTAQQNSSTLLPGQRLVITLGSQPVSLSSGISIHCTYSFRTDRTVYAVVLTPWQALYFMLGNNRLTDSLTALPWNTQVSSPQYLGPPEQELTVKLIDLLWPNDKILNGEYVVLVVITPMSADPLNMQNWLDYEMVRFKAIQGAVACTMDAMQCPDGSYVSRQPPDCKFAPCP